MSNLIVITLLLAKWYTAVYRMLLMLSGYRTVGKNDWIIMTYR